MLPLWQLLYLTCKRCSYSVGQCSVPGSHWLCRSLTVPQSLWALDQCLAPRLMLQFPSYILVDDVIWEISKWSGYNLGIECQYLGAYWKSQSLVRTKYDSCSNPRCNIITRLSACYLPYNSSDTNAITFVYDRNSCWIFINSWIASGMEHVDCQHNDCHHPTADAIETGYGLSIKG